MDNDFKIINIYIDKHKVLYGVPFGHSEKFGKRGIDKLFLLMPEYSDEMLYEFIKHLFDNCDSEDAKDNMPPAIQTYLKAKSYDEAIQNLGLVAGFYSDDTGYVFNPTKNTKEKGFTLDSEITFTARRNSNRGELINAFNKAVKSTQIGR